MTTKWTAEQIPDQRDRTAIVTGANSGLGRTVARELARRGAKVIIASRDNAKGTEAARAIKDAFPSSQVEALGFGQRMPLKTVQALSRALIAGAGTLAADLPLCAQPWRL
jgi:NAD(P)-dependent dehydrogenase (short-subunit alcohol dehydrogenase family)